ncbi:hypothetical protein BC332_05893 [Capsicum chinense]|nr:hypothetical protein BC332_05893 [Capsicum chinense]
MDAGNGGLGFSSSRGGGEKGKPLLLFWEKERDVSIGFLEKHTVICPFDKRVIPKGFSIPGGDDGLKFDSGLSKIRVSLEGVFNHFWEGGVGTPDGFHYKRFKENKMAFGDIDQHRGVARMDPGQGLPLLRIITNIDSTEEPGRGRRTNLHSNMDTLRGDVDIIDGDVVIIAHDGNATRVSNCRVLIFLCKTKHVSKLVMITHTGFQKGSNERFVEINHGFTVTFEFCTVSSPSVPYYAIHHKRLGGVRSCITSLPFSSAKVEGYQVLWYNDYRNFSYNIFEALSKEEDDLPEPDTDGFTGLTSLAVWFLLDFLKVRTTIPDVSQPSTQVTEKTISPHSEKAYNEAIEYNLFSNKHHHRVPKTTIYINWTPPPLNHYKLKVDGSCLGNPGRGGIGGVIRNHNGEWRLGFNQSYLHATDNQMELLAFKVGLTIAIHHCLLPIVINTDSLEVLQMLKHGNVQYDGCRGIPVRSYENCKISCFLVSYEDICYVWHTWSIQEQCILDLSIPLESIGLPTKLSISLKPTKTNDASLPLWLNFLGLLHDIGHGPFSHLFEREFLPQVCTGLDWSHEQMSVDMIDHIVDEHHIDIGSGTIKKVKEMILASSKLALTKSSREKQFLYDIVANGRNGIDVDKFDYIVRDTRACALGCNFQFHRLMETMRVLGDEICYRAKDYLTIHKLFATRADLHRTVYTHAKVKAIELMVVDALVKANDYLHIASHIEHPSQYWKIDDTILKTIETAPDPELKESRDLILRVRRRDLYQFCNEYVVPRDKIEYFKDVTAQDIVCSQKSSSERLSEEDVAVSNVMIDLTQGRHNPLESIHFFKDYESDEKFSIPEDRISHLLPSSYQDMIVRVYSKKPHLVEPISDAFENFQLKTYGIKAQVHATPEKKKRRI